MSKCYLVIILSLLITGCSRVKDKTMEYVKGQIQEKKEFVMNKLFPRYDSSQPDTQANKKHFYDFFGIEASNQVQNIYCMDDVIGIDASYLFTFECNETIFNQIIKKQSLTADTSKLNFAFFKREKLFWWDVEKLKELPVYSWNKNERYYKYIWYDKKLQKAYYIEYDL